MTAGSSTFMFSKALRRSSTSTRRPSGTSTVKDGIDDAEKIQLSFKDKMVHMAKHKTTAVQDVCDPEFEADQKKLEDIEKVVQELLSHADGLSKHIRGVSAELSLFSEAFNKICFTLKQSESFGEQNETTNSKSTATCIAESEQFSSAMDNLRRSLTHAIDTTFKSAVFTPLQSKIDHIGVVRAAMQERKAKKAEADHYATKITTINASDRTKMERNQEKLKAAWEADGQAKMEYKKLLAKLDHTRERIMGPNGEFENVRHTIATLFSASSRPFMASGDSAAVVGGPNDPLAKQAEDKRKQSRRTQYSIDQAAGATLATQAIVGAGAGAGAGGVPPPPTSTSTPATPAPPLLSHSQTTRRNSRKGNECGEPTATSPIIPALASAPLVPPPVPAKPPSPTHATQVSASAPALVSVSSPAPAPAAPAAAPPVPPPIPPTKPSAPAIPPAPAPTLTPAPVPAVPLPPLPLDRPPAALVGTVPMPRAGIGAGAGAADPKFTTYARMQKMGLPNGAIRQKMTQNGLSDADIACFFQASAVVGTAASAPVRHTPRDPFAAPAPAPAAPMPAPPIPPPIPNAKPAAVFVTPTAASASASAGAGAGAGAADPKFATYALMQKMGLPDGAIRQKMTQNGLSDADMASFFGGGSGGTAPVIPTTIPPAAPPARLPAPLPAPAATAPAPAGGAGLGGGLLAQIQAGKNLKKASRRASAPPARLAGLGGGGAGGAAPGGLLSQIQGFKKGGLKDAEKAAASRRASMPGGGSKWDAVKSAVGGGSGGGMLQEIMKRQAQMKAIAERDTDKQAEDSDDDGW